ATQATLFPESSAATLRSIFARRTRQSGQRDLALEYRERRAAGLGERLADQRLATPRPLGEQALEELGVEGVGVHDDAHARAEARAVDAPAVFEHRLRSGQEPRIRALAREIERHVTRDHPFLAPSLDDFLPLIDVLG